MARSERRQNDSAMPPPRTTTLGEYRLNRIGLGTNRLTDTAENRAFLRAAVDAGVGLIDTAHAYTGGESERTIGAALAPFPDDLVVATKGGYGDRGGRSSSGSSSRRASSDFEPTRSASTTFTGSTRACRSRRR